MRTYEQSIGAGQTVPFPGGRQFLLLETSSPVDVQFLGPNHETRETAEGMEAGLKITCNDRFVSVRITSASAQTVKVGISDIDDCVYNRSVGDVDADVIPGATVKDAVDVSIAATSAGTILASNSDRRVATISGDVSNTVALRIGGSTVAANRGAYLAPGESLDLVTSGEIKGYNPGGVANSVNVLWVEK